MLIVPTWPMKNGHVMPPGVVGYSILCLFILKDGLIDLHPKAPSQTHWSVSAAICSHHCEVWKALMTSSIGTPTTWREWASGRTSRNAWCSLSLASSTTSSWASITVITGPSHLPIRHSLIQASPPINYITGASQGSDASTWPLGHPGPLAFIFFSITASAIAGWPSCTIFAVASTCAVLLAQLIGPVKLNPAFFALV